MQDSVLKNKVSGGKKIKFILFTLLFLSILIIGITEIILAVTKYQSTYNKMQRFSLTQANWWVCDSVNGPRYLKNKVGEPDSIHFLREIWYYDRLKMINDDGYHDKDNFSALSPDCDSLKVLFAGDSFTWGASADIGSSFVDVFETDVKKSFPAVVWNTGIPATGTNHAIFTAKKYLPLQRSNFVILGFYTGNDFGDNLLPYDQLIFNDLASCYSLYDYDKNFNPYRISKSEAFEKATGSYPMDEINVVQKILVRSRFVTFITDLKDKIMNRLSGDKNKRIEQEYKVTKEYLKQLGDFVSDNGAELIVLVIPASTDVKQKEINYLNTIKILNELNLHYVDPIAGLTETDYLKIDGGHWKNTGHTKAGHLLSKYILDYLRKEEKHSFRK